MLRVYRNDVRTGVQFIAVASGLMDGRKQIKEQSLSDNSVHVTYYLGDADGDGIVAVALNGQVVPATVTVEQARKFLK